MPCSSAISNIAYLSLKLSPDESYKTFVNISLTCKEYNYIIEPFYKILFESLNVSDIQKKYIINLTYKQKLYLLLNMKCQMCSSNDTIIFWPHALRLCLKCYAMNTISEFDILNFKHNRYIINNKYNIKRYLIKDVKQKLEETIIPHKKEIAKKLKVPLFDLYMKSKNFALEEFPIINKVEEEYYQNIALLKYYQNKNLNTSFKNEIYEIKTKDNYDVWLKKID